MRKVATTTLDRDHLLNVLYYICMFPYILGEVV